MEGPLTSSAEVVGHASTRDGLEREVREGREVVRGGVGAEARGCEDLPWVGDTHAG